MSKELTLFEKCNAIKRTILRATAESMMYKSWNDAFKLKNIQEVPEIVSKWEKEHGSFKIDPNQLTYDELKELEFSKWDDDIDIMLIPIWLYPYLEDNLETISISGSKHSTKKDIDTDHRFGWLAYGVTPKAV
jgi:hypothetical protein